MTDVVALRERVARAVDPETWAGIDNMESIGREAPFLRKKTEQSLATADRVIDVLVDIGLEVLIEDIRQEGSPI